MGNTDSKVGFHKAIEELKSKNIVFEADNESFWQQFWKDHNINVQDVFALVSPEDIRGIREESPQNFGTLAYKCVDQIRKCTETSCSTASEQQSALNCIRLLTRLVPFFLEEPEWRSFFWSQLPNAPGQKHGPFKRFVSIDEEPSSSTQVNKGFDGPVLATTLLNSLSTLLFCPGFTVHQHKKITEEAEDLTSLDSCEYIWAAGVGFAISPPQNAQYDAARIEILKLLLACFSETMFSPQGFESLVCPNRWLEFFTSAENRQVLPLFTSLLNVVFAYDPVGYGVPYNYWMFADTKEPLVEVAVQILIACLDHVWVRNRDKKGYHDQEPESAVLKNMFVNYLNRIHREEDFNFMIDGFIRLLNNPLKHGYLPSSTKKIQFHQELLVLFWKCCDYNKRFLLQTLKSSVILEILIPILHALNESRHNPSRTGLVHVGVFILLMLSGERNFGVRLNKPYLTRPLQDIPIFSGNHADLLILVFHRLITSGHSKLQPLFDCLLTIILNVSPYVKSIAMIPASKLLHLFEAFSTPWFLYANSTNHHLVFFLLETMNNLIQYQFDGNVALVYCIIRKRALFHQLLNLPMDSAFIDKSVTARKPHKLSTSRSIVPDEPENEPSTQQESGEHGLHASLPQLPGVTKMTGEVMSFSGTGFGEEAKELPSVSGVIAEDVFEANSCTSDVRKSISMNFHPNTPVHSKVTPLRHMSRSTSVASSSNESRVWTPTTEWVQSWKSRLPLQTVIRLLQVLVPQVEKICIDKNITDESEILKFLQRGTLVGLLPLPHPILIRKYQPNGGTSKWFRTYVYGLIYLRNTNPPIWFDTKVTLFEIQSGHN